MKISLSERTRSAALIIPAVVVLMVLAALLYRWSNQVSEATSVRLADSLQMSMVNWHLNLFRDLSDICLAMRVDPDDRSELDQYVRRFAEWRAAAPYPDVVVHLYILQFDQPRRRALRLDPSALKFEPTDWPSRLNRLQEVLQQPATAGDGERYDLRGTNLRFTETFYSSEGSLAGWRFEPSIPALVRPMARDTNDWIAIELNRDVIQTRIFPDLSQRYFTGVDGLDYMIAVVAGTASRELIYSSDPGFGAQEVTDADGRMDVFGNVTAKTFGSPIYVFHKVSENAGVSGLAASIGTSWFPLIGKSSEDSDWQLIVRHRRGGALGAFVAEMHRRDLAISFGALFLLVVSVAMLIVTSQRANRLAKLQMDFVTAVSHELRSPLTIISSAAQNIALGVVEGKQQVTQYGAAIEGQARQLARLVEGILLFAATREDRQRYSLRPLKVADIIDSTLADAADLVEASRFTVEREIPPDLPPIMGDAAALSQCLHNLITNALKYGAGKRWIGIRASVHENEATKGREIQISVSDRGMGIDPGDLPRIFEPFYRSPSATAAQIHGTGLGLSLAKSISEAMHGSLTVVSIPGKGSTFTLHLPGGNPAT
ncbi:MAG TPA: HAMP domain-containing sensor histidine kinase [Terriglobia bacterium]|nr:HAMP domain-containing sensor histidine kinase [Terriglobia bacterium]